MKTLLIIVIIFSVIIAGLIILSLFGWTQPNTPTNHLNPDAEYYMQRDGSVYDHTRVTIPTRLRANEIAIMSSDGRSVLVVEDPSYEVELKNQYSPLDNLHKNRSKIVMHTYVSNRVKKNMAVNICNTIKMFPGWEFEFYDDKTAREFIKTHFPRDVLDAFDILIPGAYKADIFRLAWLVQKGGCYVDVSMVINKDMNQFFDTHDYDQFFPIDIPHRTYAIYQAFLCSRTADSPILKHVLNCIVSNVSNKKTGISSLAMTGPGGFGEAFNTYRGVEAKTELKSGPVTIKGETCFMLRHSDGQIWFSDNSETHSICETKYKGWRSDRTKGKHYNKMWKSKTIFKKKMTSYTFPAKSRWEKGQKKTNQLWQAWPIHMVMPQMHKNISAWKTQNPSMEHRFVVEEDQRTFIKDYIGKDTLLAYDTLTAEIMKTDLWVMCVLYVMGGTYVSSSSIPGKFNLKTVFHTYGANELVVEKHSDFKETPHIVFASSVTPGHSVLKQAIKTATTNINNKFTFEDHTMYAGVSMLNNIMLHSIKVDVDNNNNNKSASDHHHTVSFLTTDKGGNMTTDKGVSVCSPEYNGYKYENDVFLVVDQIYS